MIPGFRSDSGQAFPVYVAAVAGLLFLAFVYFVVGQAATTRNGAQTAADAAALAAAQDAREQLHEGWLDVILDPAQWERFLDAEDYTESSACQQAAAFAARNGANLAGDECARLAGSREGFSVTVKTTGTVGRSLVPGTESLHATASAKAVIEPKCSFVPPEPPATESPAPEEPEPDPGPTEPDEEPEPEPEPITRLTCDEVTWTIDPDDPKLPSATDLFTVRLTGDDE
ncbi:pilus assembly protein TadG-related protein [Streptomyces sp. NPDC056488]|uniref:pilus assembly protein TadG-related protein n=1 Tax=Streptomyces sp. NPDC056488 TaxID=3345836 RepID=UPI0036BBE4CB